VLLGIVNSLKVLQIQQCSKQNDKAGDGLQRLTDLAALEAC
jgi:hypothetical protein